MINANAKQSVRQLATLAVAISLATVLSACRTSETLTPRSEPSLLALGQLAVVDQTSADGDMVVARHTADAQGRFAISISPLDGSDRARAFNIAEQAYTRMCGQPPSGSGGAGEPGVGKLGSRAPYFSTEKRAYYIYMQCAGAAPVSGG